MAATGVSVLKFLNSCVYNLPIICIVQRSGGDGLQEGRPLLLFLDGIAENGRDDGLADIGIGAVHLMGTQGAPEPSTDGSHSE